MVQSQVRRARVKGQRAKTGRKKEIKYKNKKSRIIHVGEGKKYSSSHGHSCGGAGKPQPAPIIYLGEAWCGVSREAHGVFYLTRLEVDDKKGVLFITKEREMKKRKTVLFAHKCPNGKYQHFYPSEVALGLCGSSLPTVTVEVTEDPDGDYWAWWHLDQECFSMVYGTIEQFEMCFPNGSSAAEESGRGLRLKVKVAERKRRRS